MKSIYYSVVYAMLILSFNICNNFILIKNEYVLIIAEKYILYGRIKNYE